MGEPHIPAIGEGKRGEDGYLSYLLRQATTAMRGAMDRRLAARPKRRRQWRRPFSARRGSRPRSS